MARLKDMRRAVERRAEDAPAPVRWLGVIAVPAVPFALVALGIGIEDPGASSPS